jgi:hypothetical protein
MPCQVYSCPNAGRSGLNANQKGAAKLPKPIPRGRVTRVIERDLLNRVVASTGLTPAQATMVIDDVVAFFSEPVEDFVRRRHVQLKAHGLKNPDIFPAIRAELAPRVVAPPPLSDRQLRRLVYG